MLLSVQMLQEYTAWSQNGALSFSQGVAAATTVAPCFTVTGAITTADLDPSPACLPVCHLRTSQCPELGQGTEHPSQPLRGHTSLTPEPICRYTTAQHFSSAHPTVVLLHQTSHPKPSSKIRSLRISRQQQTIKLSMSPC